MRSVVSLIVMCCLVSTVVAGKYRAALQSALALPRSQRTRYLLIGNAIPDSLSNAEVYFIALMTLARSSSLSRYAGTTPC